MIARFLLPTLLLAGCTTATVDAPSLAPRAVEKIDISSEPAEPTATAVTDPAIARKAAETLATATAADRAFADALATAEPKIRAAAGAAEGSDRWVEGQLALSRLQASQVPAADALQSLDDQRAAIGDGPADAALDHARDKAAALVASQDERVSRLRTLLAPR